MPNQEESKDGLPRKDANRPSPDTTAKEPDLVSPSGVNERDHGAADDKPMGGGSVNLDDDTMEHPRGNTTRQGGTWEAQGGDSGKLGRPAEVLSDRNAPSDPANRRK
jgi:hypothetical protein